MKKVVLSLSLFFLAVIFISPEVWGCATHGHKVTTKEWEVFKKSYHKKYRLSFNRKPKSYVALAYAEGSGIKLPYPGGVGNLVPWGGQDAGRWRPEAILANAMSVALNEGWGLSGIRDVLVATPVKFYDSGFRPYGDGQSNARPSFESWNQSRPPVVASLLKFHSESPRVIFKFDRSMNLSQSTVEIAFLKNGSVTSVKIPAQRKNGDLVATWESIPKNLDWDGMAHTQVVLVRPFPNYADWFPIYFRHPVKKVNELLATVPQNQRHFFDGKSIVDGENVKQGDSNETTPFEKLTNHTFTPKYNPNQKGVPYIPQNIHAEFGAGGTVTGVGRGWTWVAEKETPFKIMYTCFERRQPSAEASAKDGGVASGGGWHKIGDPAETILNSLELEPLAVASGYARPASQMNLTLPGGNYSHGLTDVAVIRLLQPGEAFITVQSTPAEQNYHWYFFQQDREICTEEWVHPCRPTGSDPDFRCK